MAVSIVSLAWGPVRRVWHPTGTDRRSNRTLSERLAELTPAAARVRDQCNRSAVAYPPGRVVLLGLKDERRLDVYAGPAAGPVTLIASHPILGASGVLGPKLAEGDGQVPEGVYGVDSLNPNSAADVALRVGYPGPLDVDLARREGRTGLGGLIMIHGGSTSVGCLAVGDPAAEELFVLAAATGVARVTVVLSPVDLRDRPLPAGLATPRFADRYAAVRFELGRLPD